MFYKVRNKVSLLTSWLPSKEVGVYEPPADTLFADCAKSDEGIWPNPGSCVVGGRTGYSVKMVSGHYLRREAHNLGNLESGQPLENPPPRFEDGGWLDLIGP